MNEKKRVVPKSALDAKSDELVADLKAIRDHVAEKRSSTSSPEAMADLQQRLFEVWVSTRLASVICLQEHSVMAQELMREEIVVLRKQFAGLQKEVSRLAAMTEKLSAKVASQRAGKKAGEGKK